MNKPSARVINRIRINGSRDPGLFLLEKRGEAGFPFAFGYIAAGRKYSYQSMALKVGYLFEIAKHIYLDSGIVYSHGLGNIKYPYPLPDPIEVSLKNDSSSIVLRTGIQIFFK